MVLADAGRWCLQGGMAMRRAGVAVVLRERGCVSARSSIALLAGSRGWRVVAATARLCDGGDGSEWWSRSWRRRRGDDAMEDLARVATTAMRRAWWRVRRDSADCGGVTWRRRAMSEKLVAGGASGGAR